MEGFRAADLHRFGLTREIFDEIEMMAQNDPSLAGQIGERPSVGRPTQFTLTDTEPTYNPKIDNNLAARCLPKT